jgi:6-phosphogluconate dehydrogenase
MMDSWVANGHAAALAFYDAFRSPWLPANLVEAQRDYFEAHTYERIDAKGVFHAQWQASQEAPDQPPKQAAAAAGGAR